MRVYTDLQKLPSFENTVLTIGSFDGVHTGHRRILEQVHALARANGGESVVLTFEPHPRAVLHPDDPAFRLISSSEEKIYLLEQCGIDHVVLVPFTPEFARQSAKAYVEEFLLSNFHPRIVVIGYDHRFGANREGDITFLRQYEKEGYFSLVEIPAQQVDAIAVSSTKIRKALDRASIELANRLLGYSFFLTGKVVEGNRIGRKLGFPTANLQLGERYKLIPPHGIYAARARLWSEKDAPGKQSSSGDTDTGLYDAMLYIGQRPSIAGNNGKSIEVNLIDFQGDLYDKTLYVEIVGFIRPDRKLEGLEALREQIEADKEQILQRLHPQRTAMDSATSAAQKADAAVVILNYNTRKHLEAFLPSVVAHTEGAQIIVADNGSPDDSVAFLQREYPQVKVLDLGQNYGFAEGYNRALEQVDASIYVILNSDVEVTPGWTSAIVKAMRDNPAIAVAQPKILSWRDKSRFEYAGASGGWIDYLGYPFCRGRLFSHVEEDRGQYDEPRECLWASGAAFFIRADLFHAFGGFDGDYFAHNEEIDLCWRLKRAGFQVWCLPGSVVYHLGGGTLEYENPRKVFLNFRNSLFTLLKNEPVAKLLWLLPARLLLDGLAGLRFALKGQFLAIWAILRAHFSFYRNFGKTLRKRRMAAEQIKHYRIAGENNKGIYRGSVVFAYYARQVKKFSKLF